MSGAIGSQEVLIIMFAILSVGGVLFAVIGKDTV